jgi:hypothetical protein
MSGLITRIEIKIWDKLHEFTREISSYCSSKYLEKETGAFKASYTDEEWRELPEKIIRRSNPWEKED